MRTLELTKDTAFATNSELQPAILTLGSKPVAVLLHNAEELADLAQFEQVIEQEESVTLAIAGKPIAILRPLVPFVLVQDESADLESVTLSTNYQFLSLIEKHVPRHEGASRKRRGISSDEMRRRLGL